MARPSSSSSGSSSVICSFFMRPVLTGSGKAFEEALELSDGSCLNFFDTSGGSGKRSSFSSISDCLGEIGRFGSSSSDSSILRRLAGGRSDASFGGKKRNSTKYTTIVSFSRQCTTNHPHRGRAKIFHLLVSFQPNRQHQPCSRRSTSKTGSVGRPQCIPSEVWVSSKRKGESRNFLNYLSGAIWSRTLS
jgi:hypothetical protein